MVLASRISPEAMAASISLEVNQRVFDALVAHGSGGAGGEAGGEKDCHLFGEEAGAGEE